MIRWGDLGTGKACAVTYRAIDANGEDVEMQLCLEPSAATLADAWERLSALYGRIDPRTRGEGRTALRSRGGAGAGPPPADGTGRARGRRVAAGVAARIRQPLSR